MQPDMDKRLGVLNKLYEIYDGFTASLKLACQKGCSVCCTRNVTLTSLEGLNLIQNIGESRKEALISAISDKEHKKRMVPQITINKMAELCMEGKEIPTEESDPSWGPCPVLSDNCCPVYAFRPFACRCMVSEKECGKSGYAEMDDFIITVNNVFMQYIEHIDAKGYSGNFTDILLFLNSDENRSGYTNGISGDSKGFLIKNSQVRMLMVPPEHREQIKPLLEEFQKI